MRVEAQIYVEAAPLILAVASNPSSPSCTWANTAMIECYGSQKAAQLPLLEEELDVPRAPLVGGHKDAELITRRHKDLVRLPRRD